MKKIQIDLRIYYLLFIRRHCSWTPTGEGVVQESGPSEQVWTCQEGWGMGKGWWEDRGKIYLQNIK